MNCQECISSIKYISKEGDTVIKLTVDEILKSKNITRYELAKKTGIGYPIIDKYYKNSIKRYDSYILDKICSALDCSIAELIKYEGESN